jgi:predicted Zn-dependent peptidase
MIKTGSIYENKDMIGAAHLLEHVLFRGNSQYNTQKDLSLVLDSIGARYNAYTDTNLVSFHIKVQKKYLVKCLDILGNMIGTSILRPKDIDEEKLIVCQELEKDKDNAMRYVNELVQKLIFKGNNYSRLVGGTIKSVKKIDPIALKQFWKNNYNTNNIVLSIAGNLNGIDIKDAIINSPFYTKISKSIVNKYNIPTETQLQPRYNGKYRKELNQIQLSVGFPTCSNNNPDRFVLDIIKTILAGPMSSRLFGLMRNQYGIAYNVDAYISLNDISGSFIITSGVDSSGLFSNQLGNDKIKADPLKVIFDELQKMSNKKVNDEELNMAKEFIKGNFILETEDSEIVSQYYGRQRICQNDIYLIEDYLDLIDNVSSNDVLRVCKEIFQMNKLNLTIIGNYNKDKLVSYMKLLESYYN